MKKKIFVLILSALLLLSACGSAAKDNKEDPDIAGVIVEETGSSYNYVGWWQLTEHNTDDDPPFTFVEIPPDNSGVVNCYDADNTLIDSGHTDYSEQRALNGNPLMVLVFQNLGQYAVDIYSPEGNKESISIWNQDQFKGSFAYINESRDTQSAALQPDNSTIELAAKTASSKTTKTPAKRSYTFAEYDGWWHHIPDSKFSIGDVLYIDSKAGTYSIADKYGNVEEVLEAEYDGVEDMLFLEPKRTSAADAYYMCFSENDINNLYDFDDFSGDGKPSYVRGKAPVAPKVSTTGLPGKWYRDGVTKGNNVHVLELLKDGSYRFLDSAGKKEESGKFSVKMKVGSFYMGDDYDFISLELNDSNGYVADSRALIAIYYEYEDDRSGLGYSIGSNIYIHESKIGTAAAKDALQRYQIHDLNWESKDGKNSPRFSLDGQVHNYISFEHGWMPEKVGTWEYKDSVLTIKWHSEYKDYKLTKLAKVKKESCTVSDVTKGFKLPSLGQIIMEKVED